jgi:hypothetical protein
LERQFSGCLSQHAWTPKTGGGSEIDLAAEAKAISDSTVAAMALLARDAGGQTIPAAIACLTLIQHAAGAELTDYRFSLAAPLHDFWWLSARRDKPSACLCTRCALVPVRLP